MILRYWALAPAANGLSLLRVSYAISVGQAVNSVFPARAGDLVKAALLTRNPRGVLAGNFTGAAEGDRRFTFMKAIGLIVADRIVDVSTLIFIVLLSGAFFVPATKIPQTALPSWEYVVGGLAIVAVLLLVWRQAVHSHVSKTAAKISAWLADFRGGFGGMTSGRKVALGVLFAALSWGCELLSLMWLSHLQGYPLGVSQAVFILLALNFFISVPLSIANFGPFEAGVVMALKMVSEIPTEQALAVATVHHIAQVSSVTVIALVSFGVFRFFSPKYPA